MPFTLTMPKLSPTMEMGTIVKWHKKIGDHVNSGDAVVEIATDKATVEYEVLDSGWLREILLPEGQEAVVNAPMAIFTEEEGESIEGYAPEGNISAPIEPPAPNKQPMAKQTATPPPESTPSQASTQPTPRQNTPNENITPHPFHFLW